MTKPFFWIAFAVVLTAALFLGLRNEIHRSHRDLEKRLLQAIGRQGSGSLASHAESATSSSSTEKLFEVLQDACERIPTLAILPEALKKEKDAADRAEKEIASLGNQGFELTEARFLRPGGLEFRRRLLRLMGRIDSDRAFQVAKSSFLREGEDYNVRWAAAAVMKELNANEARPLVSDFLLRQTGHLHPGLSYLVDTLREIGGHEVAQTLIQVMHDLKKELSVRNAAVRALGELRAVEAYPALQDMAASHPNIYFRMNAARAMLEVKPQEGCDFLRETLRQEKSEDFKQFLDQLLRDRCSS